MSTIPPLQLGASEISTVAVSAQPSPAGAPQVHAEQVAGGAVTPTPAVMGAAVAGLCVQKMPQPGGGDVPV
jgi:hypothetical protein